MSAVLETESVTPRPFKARVVRRYSRQDRLEALALYDTLGSYEKTSEALGIPMSTLAGWARNDEDISQDRSQKQAEMSAKVRNAANIYL